MYRFMSKSLWWVTKGRATAPPGMRFIMGVSICKAVNNIILKCPRIHQNNVVTFNGFQSQQSFASTDLQCSVVFVRPTLRYTFHILFKYQLHIDKWLTSAPMWASYLQKAKLVQETTQVSDDFCPRHKLLPNRVIQNQIQVSLTEPCFL